MPERVVGNEEIDDTKVVYRVKQDESVTPEFGDDVGKITLTSAHIDGWVRNRPTLVTVLYDGLQSEEQPRGSQIRTPLPLAIFENPNDQNLKFAMKRTMNVSIFVIGPGTVTITGCIKRVKRKVETEEKQRLESIEELSNEVLFEKLKECELKEQKLKKKFIQLIDSNIQ